MVMLQCCTRGRLTLVILLVTITSTQGFIIKQRQHDILGQRTFPYPVIAWYRSHFLNVIRYKQTTQKPSVHPIVTKNYCQGCCYNPACWSRHGAHCGKCPAL